MISRHEAIIRLRAASWVEKAEFQRIFKILGGNSDHCARYYNWQTGYGHGP